MMQDSSQSYCIDLSKVLLKALATSPETPIAVMQNGENFTVQDFFEKAFTLKEEIHKNSMSNKKWGVYTDSCVNGLIAIFGVLWSGNAPVLLPNACEETLCGLDGLVDGYITETADLKTSETLIRCDQMRHYNRQQCDLKTVVIPKNANIYLFTSGSTGQPELICKQFSVLDIELYALNETFSEQLKSAPVLSTVSHQHIYGLLTRLLWPLATNRLIIDGLLRFPHEVSDQLQKYPQACLISSPAFLKRAGHVVDFPNANNKTIVFSSGGPLSAATSMEIQARGSVSVVEIFGSTETGGIAFREQKSDKANIPWTRLPRVEVRAPEGILEILSPHMGGDDWWKTQDRATIDGAGFTMQGRADRLVKVEEKRVHLDDIETFLTASPLVNDAHALVLEQKSSQLCAVVVPSDDGWDIISSQGREDFCKGLKSHLAKRFEAVTFPRRWRFVKKIPTNAQGKRQFTRIESLFNDDEISSNLPEVTDSTAVQAGEDVTISFYVPPALPTLQGHFPEQPIVAGVVQLHWADHFARQHFGLIETSYKMNQIKFKKVMKPNAHYQLKLNLGASVKFEFRGDENIYASGELSYRDAE